MQPDLIPRGLNSECLLHILAWASALPSDIDRAMREASSSRTVTDTDSYAFLHSIKYLANEGNPAAY